MTVSTTTNRVTYTGTGTAGPFSYSFRVIDTDHLAVTTTSPSGAVATLSYPADFSASGIGNRSGGSITLTSPLASGYTLVIRRVMPLEQPTDLRTLGTFPPESIENALDRGVMIAQQLDEEIGRTVTLPVSVDPDVVSAELPAPVANTALFWNTTADGLETRVLNNSDNVALPGAGRTTSTLTAYLSNNAIFNARDYGAGNGVAATTNLAAINDAISEANNVGGGTVLVDIGTFNISSHVAMKSGVTLVIGPSATLQRTNTSSALTAYFGSGVTNATISGTGVIYGPDVATSINDGSVIVFEGCTRCGTGPGLQVQGGKVAGIALLTGATNVTLDRPVITRLNEAANQSDNADIYIRYGGQSGHRILYPECLSTTKRGGIGIQPLTDGLDITDILIQGAHIQYCNGGNGHGVFGYVGVGGGYLKRIRVLDSVIEDTDNIGLYFIGALSGIEDLRLERNTLRRNVRVGTGGTLSDSVIALNSVTFGKVVDNTIEGSVSSAYPNPTYGLRMINCTGVRVKDLAGRYLNTMAVGVYVEPTSSACSFDEIDLDGSGGAGGVTAVRLEGDKHVVGTLTLRNFQNGLTTGSTTKLTVQRLVTFGVTNNAINVNGSSTDTNILSHDWDGGGTIADAGVRTRLPMGTSTLDADGILRIATQAMLSGNAAGVVRLLMGTGVTGGVATSYSGGDFMAYTNAKPSVGADSWTQSNAGTRSLLLKLTAANGLELYQANAGTGTAAFATFWGATPIWSLATNGTIKMSINGTQVVTTRGAAVTTVGAPSGAYVQAEAQAAATAINAIIARLQAHGLIA